MDTENMRDPNLANDDIADIGLDSTDDFDELYGGDGDSTEDIDESPDGLDISDEELEEFDGIDFGDELSGDTADREEQSVDESSDGLDISDEELEEFDGIPQFDNLELDTQGDKIENDKPTNNFDELAGRYDENITDKSDEASLFSGDFDDLDNLSVEELDTLIKGLESETNTSSDESDESDGIASNDSSNNEGSADTGGSILGKDTLMENYEIVSKDNDFINSDGNIVVMDQSDSEDSFKLIYIDIENIAVVQRIRSGTNVDDLVKSIQSTGLLEPLVVAPTANENTYVLLAGFRRLLACARCGKRKIPCIVNTRVNVPDIPVLEAMYNHSKRYSIKEIVEYIDYLEKEKGIMSASMIEYLLQLNSGDYTKLKDILNDNDDDIVSKLMLGQFTIEQAFKKLEQRRKKESAEEKELKKTEKAYDESEELEHIKDSGEEADGEALSDEEIQEIAVGASKLNEGLEEASLDEMVKEGNDIAGYEPHQQKVGEREIIDPAIRKAVMSRDNFTCFCCQQGGESFVDAMDFHHILPVFLGGKDTTENGVCLCLTCHHLVHTYSTGDLHIPAEKSKEELDKLSPEELVRYKDNQMRFKRIVKLGTVIREAVSRRGMKREKFRNEHPNTAIGRIKPGSKQTLA